MLPPEHLRPTRPMAVLQHAKVLVANPLEALSASGKGAETPSVSGKHAPAFRPRKAIPILHDGKRIRKKGYNFE